MTGHAPDDPSDFDMNPELKKETLELGVRYSGHEPDSGVIFIPHQGSPVIRFSLGFVYGAKFRPRDEKERDLLELVGRFDQGRDGLIAVKPDGNIRRVLLEQGEPIQDDWVFVPEASDFVKQAIDAVGELDSEFFGNVGKILEGRYEILLREVSFFYEVGELLIELFELEQSEETDSQDPPPIPDPHDQLERERLKEKWARGRPERVRQQFGDLLREYCHPTLFSFIHKALAEAKRARTQKDTRRAIFSMIPLQVRLRMALQKAVEEARELPTKRRVKDVFEELHGEAPNESSASETLKKMGFGWLPDGRRNR